MGKKKNKNKKALKSHQPLFPGTVDYAIAIQKELGKLADETVAKIKSTPARPIDTEYPAMTVPEFLRFRETLDANMEDFKEKFEKGMAERKEKGYYAEPTTPTVSWPALSGTPYGLFAIERCAGSAFLLGPDGSRWFATTELRAETIATVLNSHMGEYVTVRADILKRKGGVEV